MEEKEQSGKQKKTQDKVGPWKPREERISKGGKKGWGRGGQLFLKVIKKLSKERSRE